MSRDPQYAKETPSPVKPLFTKLKLREVLQTVLAAQQVDYEAAAVEHTDKGYLLKVTPYQTKRFHVLKLFQDKGIDIDNPKVGKYTIDLQNGEYFLIALEKNETKDEEASVSSHENKDEDEDEMSDDEASRDERESEESTDTIFAKINITDIINNIKKSNTTTPIKNEDIVIQFEACYSEVLLSLSIPTSKQEYLLSQLFEQTDFTKLLVENELEDSECRVLITAPSSQDIKAVIDFDDLLLCKENDGYYIYFKDLSVEQQYQRKKLTTGCQYLLKELIDDKLFEDNDNNDDNEDKSIDQDSTDKQEELTGFVNEFHADKIRAIATLCGCERILDVFEKENEKLDWYRKHPEFYGIMGEMNSKLIFAIAEYTQGSDTHEPISALLRGYEQKPDTFTDDLIFYFVLGCILCAFLNHLILSLPRITEDLHNRVDQKIAVFKIIYSKEMSDFMLKRIKDKSLDINKKISLINKKYNEKLQEFALDSFQFLVNPAAIYTMQRIFLQKELGPTDKLARLQIYLINNTFFQCYLNYDISNKCLENREEALQDNLVRYSEIHKLVTQLKFPFASIFKNPNLTRSVEEKLLRALKTANMLNFADLRLITNHRQKPVLYRGISERVFNLYKDKIEKSQSNSIIITLPGFTSTSTDESSALDFGGIGDYEIIIDCPVAIPETSIFGDEEQIALEQEILLPPGVKVEANLDDEFDHVIHFKIISGLLKPNNKEKASLGNHPMTMFGALASSQEQLNSNAPEATSQISTDFN